MSCRKQCSQKISNKSPFDLYFFIVFFLRRPIFELVKGWGQLPHNCMRLWLARLIELLLVWFSCYLFSHTNWIVVHSWMMTREIWWPLIFRIHQRIFRIHQMSRYTMNHTMNDDERKRMKDDVTRWSRNKSYSRDETTTFFQDMR